MDSIAEQRNREAFRRIILKQEKIFREQVQELHRLYRVQKVLLAEHGRKELNRSPYPDNTQRSVPAPPEHAEDRRAAIWGMSASPRGSSSPYDSFRLCKSVHEKNNAGEGMDSSSRAQSSSSQDASIFLRGFDLESAAEQDTSPVANEGQTLVFGINLKEEAGYRGSEFGRVSPTSESDLELNLSIGCGPGRNKFENGKHMNPFGVVGHDQITNRSGLNVARFDQENLRGPPWHLHPLGLRRTC